jgi:hypothetical protein
MTDVAQKIEDRSYQSPGRARAALARSHVSAAARRKLSLAIDAWEGEGSLEPPVVGALPPGSNAAEVHEAELVDRAEVPSGVVRKLGVTVSLNVPVRARLTPYGMHVLYTRRKIVPGAEDALGKGGVWETTLAQFMLAFGEHLEGPEQESPVEDFAIEVFGSRP